MTSKAQAEEYVRKYEAMHLYHQLGATLKFIGDKYGLSKERVRQILMKRERCLRVLQNGISEADEIKKSDAIAITEWLHAWGAEHDIVFKE